MLRLAALALTLHASLASCNYHTEAPTVKVKNGTYLGHHSVEYNQDFFLGVPYAQPPVGGLRFRDPVSLNRSWTDARPATNYSGEANMQAVFSV